MSAKSKKKKPGQAKKAKQPVERTGYHMDLGSLIMVYLPKVYKAGDASSSKEAGLIDLLSAVFNKNLDLEAKRAKMKERGIAMTEKVEGGVIEMCNLGEGIAEQTRAETRLEEHKKSAKMIFEKLHAPVETVAEMYPDLSYDTIKMLKAECDNANK